MIPLVMLAELAYSLGVSVCCFILLIRNDELANEIVQLTFDRERIK